VEEEEEAKFEERGEASLAALASEITRRAHGTQSEVCDHHGWRQIASKEYWAAKEQQEKAPRIKQKHEKSKKRKKEG